MAKIKVFELAKEVDKQSKDVIGFLQNAGVDVKAAQSSVEDDAADMVRRAFGKKAAEAAAFGNKGGAAAGAESAPKTGTSEKPAASKQDAAKADAQKKNPSGQNASRQNAPQQNAPKKKKTIIFVSNPQNSKMSGSRPGGGQRPQGSGNRGYANGRYQTPNRPIKPLTPPSPTPSVQMVDSKPQQPKRPAENVNPPKQAETKPAGAAETAASANRTQQQQPARQPERSEHVTEQPVRQSERPVRQPDRPSHQPDRPARQSDRPAREGGYNSGARSQDNRGRDFRGGQRPQGGQYQGRDARPGQGGRPQGGSTYGGGERSGQGGYNRQGRPGYGGQNERRGTGAAPGRGFGGGRDARGSGQGGRGGYGAAPSDGMDKKRDDSRRSARERDNKRSSKKDHIYEEEEARRNRPGRFIKPEKKEEVEEVIKVITLPETITLKELAEKMKMQPAVIIKKLFLDGKVVTMNQELSYEDAENIAMEYEILCEKEVKVDVIEELLMEEEEPEENLVERPPVICVMGHVDHGKTSLLDAIRKTHVTDREAGGITQHIGAYTVTLGERKITFLDTPGHEAFTAMRMRGANSTDIAVLVVAADDGVMPQTIEAINHAKAAGIEIVVAVNKIDKPSANVERVKQELTEYDLVATDWGGNTEFVPVSAKTGEGISNLLETILLTADILELKANPNRRARGLVIEAKLDKGRGPVANILVQKGTLHVGDFVSAGACSGKVRAMIDDKGRSVKSAGPSMPVEVLGLNDVPAAGEVIIAHDTDKEAKSYADTYKAQYKEKKLEETKSRMSLDDLFSQIQEGNLKELNLIIKADVQGSVEAVKTSLLKLSNDEVVVKCIHGGVGAITESDVALASASNAIIIGFNVRPDASAKETAEHEGVDVRLYKVIYQAIEDVEAAMKGMLDPVFEEKIIGHAEVRQIFKASKVGNIAGSYVTDGEVQRDCKVRITRAGEQIYEGTLTSLKRFKDDAKEVKAGYECGLVFDGFDQMQELDIVEAYIMVEVPRN